MLFEAATNRISPKLFHAPSLSVWQRVFLEFLYDHICSIVQLFGLRSVFYLATSYYGLYKLKPDMELLRVQSRYLSFTLMTRCVCRNKDIINCALC